MNNIQIPVGVSNRHLHVSREDLDHLFGQGYELTVYKELNQPGQYAAKETVEIIGPKGSFPKVRILGPVRSATQIEVSLSDSYKLGVSVSVRDSGAVDNTPGLKLKGPQGVVELKKGVIAARRHIHMTPKDANALGVVDNDIVKVKTLGGIRELTFENVLVRVREDFALEMHVDIDEANAAGLANGDTVIIVE